MARPVYPYELGDPDFSWLLATFQESNPDYKIVDISCLPLILVKVDKHVSMQPSDAAADFVPDAEVDEDVLEKNE
jgi:hypothetical protein